MSMTHVLTLMAIIVVHFVADFVLQTDKMAKGKSKENKWLLIHTSVYSLPLLIFGWEYALLNGVAHTVVDYFSSRLSSKMWAQGRVHDFFVVIGADQAIHMATLVLSMPLIWWMQ